VTGDLAEAADSISGLEAYARLVAELDAAGARYRLIEHEPEGTARRKCERHCDAVQPLPAPGARRGPAAAHFRAH